MTLRKRGIPYVNLVNISTRFDFVLIVLIFFRFNMPKNSRQEHNYDSKKSYTRPPIHRKAENEEDINDEEEDEEIHSDLFLHQTTLYPDLSEELLKSRKTLKSKDTEGKRGKKAEQSVMSENSDSSSNTSTLKYIISVLILIVAAIGGIFFFNSPKKPSDKINVAELVTDMQNHFQMKNPDDAFKILSKALTKVVKPEPRAPAIITVLANKGAEKTTSEFSVHLAEALAPGSYLSIKESLGRKNSDELKYDIDTKIKSQLDTGTLSVIIVDRLNDIPVEAAMIFHGFCDHEYAPFKRAVYLFIVHLGTRIPENSTTTDIDAIAMESLKNIWRASTDDGIDSLITRITVNIVSIL